MIIYLHSCYSIYSGNIGEYQICQSGSSQGWSGTTGHRIQNQWLPIYVSESLISSNFQYDQRL
jgi:hypothetical protein